MHLRVYDNKWEECVAMSSGKVNDDNETEVRGHHYHPHLLNQPMACTELATPFDVTYERRNSDTAFATIVRGGMLEGMCARKLKTTEPVTSPWHQDLLGPPTW